MFDIKIPGLPLGLSGDPGSVPIYKNGEAVGGVGIEGDALTRSIAIRRIPISRSKK